MSASFWQGLLGWSFFLCLAIVGSNPGAGFLALLIWGFALLAINSAFD